MQRSHSRQIALWLLLLCGLAVPATGVAETLQLAGAGGALESMRHMGTAFAQHVPGATVKVLPAMGSQGSIKAVLAGAIDISLSTRALQDKEIRAGAQARAYALVPLVFITPKDNPHQGFSQAEIVEIYDGRRTTWPDGTLIRLVLRPATDSDYAVVTARIPGLQAAYTKALQRRGLPIGLTDQEAADYIQNAHWGLGTSVLPLLLSENRPLKALQLDGVAPTLENLANGSYPLTKTLYFVTTASPRPLVQQFLAFVHTDAGAAILRQTGHHPLVFTVEK